jgi:hypothetical protein
VFKITVGDVRCALSDASLCLCAIWQQVQHANLLVVRQKTEQERAQKQTLLIETKQAVLVCTCIKQTLKHPLINTK